MERGHLSAGPGRQEGEGPELWHDACMWLNFRAASTCLWAAYRSFANSQGCSFLFDNFRELCLVRENKALIKKFAHYQANDKIICTKCGQVSNWLLPSFHFGLKEFLIECAFNFSSHSLLFSRLGEQ